MGKNKKEILIIAISLSIIIILISGAISHFMGSDNKMNDAKYKKVLILGLDGMDPEITNKLIAEGKLPNFKKLAETGSFVNLNTSYPPHSPVAWTSIATGVNPGKHNIFDFIRRNPQNYLPELSLSKSPSGISGTNYESYIKAAPFWRITSNKKIPTTVIRWPMSFPPERVEGNLLSGLGTPDIRGFLSGYSFYTTKELTTQDKTSNKVQKVELNNGLIETYAFGPKTRKAGDIIDIKEHMKIKLNKNSADITIQEKTYNVKLNSWSDWIRVKFKVSIFKSVYGIFKANLINLDPFEMYITAVQIDPENPITDISSPSEYSGVLAKDIGIYYTLGIPEETDGFVDEKINSKVFLEQVDQVEEQRNKMFWKEFENFKKSEKGLYAFVFDSSDRIQHVFWEEKILEKKGNNNSIPINKVVEEYWVNKDEFLGKVLQELDDETLLIIVSDHGFTSFERAVSLNTWLVKNGFMTLKKELGNEEGSLFQYVDWSKTKAYALGFNSIYINLENRESKGIVENKEEVVQEIITKLENLKDAKTRKNVVNKAYKTSEIYSGNYINNAPDIIVGYNPGYRTSWQTAVGGFTKEVLTDNKKIWNGDHLVDPIFVPGVLFANVKLTSESASQLDIAPTILDALGIEIPKEIDGKSLLK